jgi:hypothetical protein
MKDIKLLNKEYKGFESWSDIGRDVEEMYEGKDVPAEGQGKIVVKIVYIPANEDTDDEICGLCNCRDCGGGSCPCR